MTVAPYTEAGVKSLWLLMRIHAFTCRTAIWATLIMAAALRAPADPVPKANPPERSYTGMVVDVDTNEQIFWVKRWLLPGKQFVFGDDCRITLLYAMVNNGVGSGANLRQGEKVTVGYQLARGVRIADRIEQQPMQLTGTVKAVDLKKHVLILHRRMSNQRLAIAPNCIITLQNKNPATLADIHPGDHVVVIYEMPDDVPVAWQITR
jgi:hypothetical protein